MARPRPFGEEQCLPSPHPLLAVKPLFMDHSMTESADPGDHCGNPLTDGETEAGERQKLVGAGLSRSIVTEQK